MSAPFDERTLGAFRDLVRHFAPLESLAEYPCKVVSQNDDGTFEVRPDDARIPPLSKVPARHGAPGEKVTLAGGARALLGFEGGDETKPYVTAWEAGEVEERELSATKVTKIKSAVVELGVGAKRAVACVGDFGQLGGPLPIPCLIQLPPGPNSGSPAPATITFPVPVMIPIVSGSGSAKAT